MNLFLGTIRLVDQVRPGLLTALTEEGTVNGDILTISEPDYLEAMQPYGELIGVLELRAGGAGARLRTLPVSDAEAERCRAICLACPMFDTMGSTCLDKDCGCYRSGDRREPWLNRQTHCHFW